MDGWVIFLLGLVLGIPLSIFANIATPWVITYFKNRSLSSRQRKVVEMITRYERVIGYKENPITLVIRVTRVIMIVLLFLTTLVVITTIPSSPFIIQAGGLSMLVATYLVISLTTALMNDVNNFEEYKRKFMSSLSKLGYSLEEAQELKNNQMALDGSGKYRKENPKG